MNYYLWVLTQRNNKSKKNKRQKFSNYFKAQTQALACVIPALRKQRKASGF